MNEPLRPMTLGEILDRTAQLYRSRFLVFLGISLFPAGVVLGSAFLVGLVAGWWSWRGAASVSSGLGFTLVGIFVIAVIVVALPILLAAISLAAAAMNHAASSIYLGETATIRDSYKTVWRRGWRYIGLFLLEVLLVAGVPLALWIVLLLLAALQTYLVGTPGKGAAANPFLGVPALLFLAVLAGYAFWMLLRLSLAFPASVVEQFGSWSAIKRSTHLSKGTKGRIFLLYLLVGILGFVLSMGVTIPLMVLLALIPYMRSANTESTGMMIFLFFAIYGPSFAVQALIKPIYSIGLVLFYYDQRIRKEGYDIEWMMQAAGLTQPAAAAPILEPSQDAEAE
jgi:hypothetical protein